MGNPIVHWELMVTDLDKGKAFYSAVFDWKFDESTYPGYTLIDTGSQPGGGMLAKPETAPACALSTYFAVDDLEAALSRAAQAGATVVMPATAIEGVGLWAMFADPDGIPIALLQPEGQM